MSPKDAEGIANSVDPDQSSLIWVCTVCPGLSVQKVRIITVHALENLLFKVHMEARGARWLSGRVSDSGARGPGFETYRRRVVSLSKTLYTPKVLVYYPGSDGSVPT